MQPNSHPTRLKNITLLTISIVCFLLFFFLQRYIFSTDLQQIQLMIHQFFTNLQSPLLNRIVIFITTSGNTLPILVLIAIISLTFYYFHYKIEALFLPLNLLALATSNYILKLIFQRARPSFNPLIEQGGYSFPSGHAMINFGMGIFISYLIFKLLQYAKPAITISCVIMVYVILIGISRVYVGVHYLSDVLGGWLFGSAVTCLMILLFEWVLNRHIHKHDFYYRKKY